MSHFNFLNLPFSIKKTCLVTLLDHIYDFPNETFVVFNPLWIICLAKQVYKVPKNKNKIEFFSVFSALPRGGPTIKGGRLRYSLGDSVDVNCTSADSKPAADLHWFINGQPVSKNTFLTFWPEREMSCRDRRPKVYLYNLSAFFFFYQKCHVKRLLLWK